MFLQNTRLPSSWINADQVARPSDICNLPYGVAGNVYDSENCSSIRDLAVRPITSVVDGKHHTEAFILIFAVENSIPISTVPQLVELAKVMSKDPKVLNEIRMQFN